jgi:serine/threonine-protein kinase RsbW
MAQMVFPAKLENLEKMFAFIRDASSRQGFDDQMANKIQIACEEALVNVINYAYPDKQGELELVCVNGTDGLTITISDSGIPFDPLSLPEPDIHAPMEQRRVGGLGVFMMRKIMNSVTYRREGERNILTLVKK